MMLQRIFHPTDFSSGAEAALRFALEVARRFDAELLVGHVAPGVAPGFKRTQDLEERLRETVERTLEGRSSTSQDARVSVHVIDQPGPSEGIVAFAGEQDIDLIVLGRYGGRPIRRLIMGSVAFEVMHAARTDVLIVPDGREPRRPPAEKHGGVLVPLDLRDRSVPLTSSAAEIARRFGANVELLHVIDLPERLQLRPDAFESDIGSLVDVAKERLTATAADSEAGVEVSTRVESGHPAETILRVADQGAFRMLVLASSGMGPDERVRHYPLERERYDELQWIVSRVTERVATYAPVPVWIVKRFPAKVPRTTPAQAVQDPSVQDV